LEQTRGAIEIVGVNHAKHRRNSVKPLRGDESGRTEA